MAIPLNLHGPESSSRRPLHDYPGGLGANPDPRDMTAHNPFWVCRRCDSRRGQARLPDIRWCAACATVLRETRRWSRKCGDGDPWEFVAHLAALLAELKPPAEASGLGE